MERRGQFKPLIVIAMFFAALGAASFISVKVGMMFGLIFTVGAIPYALTYPCIDVICETRGRLRAYQVVLAGLVAHVFAFILTFVALAIPAENVWAPPAGVASGDMSSLDLNRYLAFDSLFAVSPQLVAAGFVAYLITQVLNVMLFDRLRRISQGRHLWLRNNVSTGVCQFVDTIIFVPLAFGPLIDRADLLAFIAGQFAIKLVIALLDTPLVYLGVWWLKGSGDADRADAAIDDDGEPATGRHHAGEVKPGAAIDAEAPTGPLPQTS